MSGGVTDRKTNFIPLLRKRYLTGILIFLVLSNSINADGIERRNLVGIDIGTFIVPGFWGYYGRIIDRHMMELRIPLYYVRFKDETKHIGTGVQLIRFLPALNESMFTGGGIVLHNVFGESVDSSNLFFTQIIYGHRWSYRSIALHAYLQFSYLMSKTSDELRRKLVGPNSNASLGIAVTVAYRF